MPVAGVASPGYSFSMIDRDRLAEVRERFAELRAAQERGAVDDRLVSAVTDDLEWLIERVEGLADDNERLARMVADITDVVRDAKRERLAPVTEAIDAALGDSGDGSGETN